MNRSRLCAAAGCATHRPTRGIRRMSCVALLATLLFATSAHAQQAPSPTPQFDMLGFIQSATLYDGSMCPGVDPALWCATVTMNGITMTAPGNRRLQTPSTWSTRATRRDADERATA